MLCITAKLACPCPLWVTSRQSVISELCPLYPQKRTKSGHLGMSLRANSALARCSKKSLLNHLVGSGSGVGGTSRGIRGTVRFLRRHEDGRSQAPSFGGVAETFDARNRGARVRAMDI